MKVGRKFGLSCGHFTLSQARDFDFENKNSPYQYYCFIAPIIGQDKEYCETCNDSFRIIRIHAFEISRDIPELT